MRLLAWNLNHRAARREIPDWIAAAIASQRPDVLILTEYVQGPSHDRFLSALRALGLSEVDISARRKRQNQVLIAAREPLRRGELALPEPEIHEAVPSNVLHVVLERTAMNVVGFRLPSFDKKEHRPHKRATWEWLLREAAKLRHRPAVIAGDFNTAPGDKVLYCGDCFDQLVRSGWVARPETGCSWRNPHSGRERQIDHVFLSPALNGQAKYVWEFQSHSLVAASGNVGIPDHAMVVADID